jgi:hypothetical protein
MGSSDRLLKNRLIIRFIHPIMKNDHGSPGISLIMEKTTYFLWFSVIFRGPFVFHHPANDPVTEQ